MIQGECIVSHTHESQDSQCIDEINNELRNKNNDVIVAEQKIKKSKTIESSSLEDSFDMLKDICNNDNPYANKAEDHATTLPSVPNLGGDTKRDSTPIHNKNIQEGKKNQSILSKAKGQKSTNSDDDDDVHDDGSTITYDSKQILPSMVNSELTAVGNHSTTEKLKCCSDKHHSISNLTDQGSSLSLRPSMISSSVIENDSQIGCEKQIPLKNLGDTICSSVHESRLSQDQVVTHEKIRDSSSANLCSVDRHEFHSFLSVGHHLFSSSMCMDESTDHQTSEDETSHVSNTKNERNDWWEDFSDNDWDTMKEAAQFIIDEREQIRETKGSSNNKSSKKNLPIIPPSPPYAYLASHGGRSTDSLSTIASSESQNDSSSLLLHSTFIPREFICPLCKDIIVGAAIFDCTCAMNTFCSSCLEENFLHHDTGDEHQNQIRNEKKCPSCDTHVTRSVPCHTLDVAILNAVKDINTDIVKETSQQNAPSIKQEDIVNFQHRFYKRLLSWRNNVLKRHKVASLERERQQEVLLSLLIQKEEELFWKIKQEVNATDDDCSKVEEDVVPEESSDRHLQIHRTRMVDVAMVAAAAFVGMSLLRRN